MHSPDCSGNPWRKKSYYFLAKKERPTEAPFLDGKIAFMKQDCNEKREIAPEK